MSGNYYACKNHSSAWVKGLRYTNKDLFTQNNVGCHGALHAVQHICDTVPGTIVVSRSLCVALATKSPFQSRATSTGTQWSKRYSCRPVSRSRWPNVVSVPFSAERLATSFSTTCLTASSTNDWSGTTFDSREKNYFCCLLLYCS